MMDEVDRIPLPDARLTRGQLYGIVGAIRPREHLQVIRLGPRLRVVPKEELLTFCGDVGRHNRHRHHRRLDGMNPNACVRQPRRRLCAPFPMSGRTRCSTHRRRLTSEMVIKSAQMGVPIVVSRSSMTQIRPPPDMPAVGPVRHRARPIAALSATAVRTARFCNQGWRRHPLCHPQSAGPRLGPEALGVIAPPDGGRKKRRLSRGFSLWYGGHRQVYLAGSDRRQSRSLPAVQPTSELAGVVTRGAVIPAPPGGFTGGRHEVHDHRSSVRPFRQSLERRFRSVRPRVAELHRFAVWHFC